jgi:hypothetical protein
VVSGDPPPFDELLHLADDIERTARGAPRARTRVAPPDRLPPSPGAAGRRTSARWMLMTGAALVVSIGGLLVVDRATSVRTVELARDAEPPVSLDDRTTSTDAGPAPVCDEAALAAAFGTIDGVAFTVDAFACEGRSAYARLRPADPDLEARLPAVFAAARADGDRWSRLSTSWLDDCRIRVRAIEPTFPTSLCDEIN